MLQLSVAVLYMIQYKKVSFAGLSLKMIFDYALIHILKPFDF